MPVCKKAVVYKMTARLTGEGIVCSAVPPCTSPQTSIAVVDHYSEFLFTAVGNLGNLGGVPGTYLVCAKGFHMEPGYYRYTQILRPRLA